MHHGEEHEHRHPGTPITRPANDDEATERDSVTPASRGLGALYGDAERTPSPGPVKGPGPIDRAAMDAVAEEYELVRTEEGENYLTPRDGDSEQATTDDYPDHPLG
jgi:hypothetical protein